MSEPVIMGVLNCTPDSFYDGTAADAGQRAEKGLRLAEEGADIIDVGGESTRPGAKEVAFSEEIDRVIPVIEGIRKGSAVEISVDTRRAEVAKIAVRAGAGIINDVSAGRDPEMFGVAAATRARYVLMHMQGVPETMQKDPRYGDVVAEVLGFLCQRTAALVSAGVPESSIIWDPGIGFGKKLEHNLAILRNLRDFVEEGHDLCIGVSRKSLIGLISPSTGKNPADRLAGSLAFAGLAWRQGASILRVHDVAATRQYLEVLQAAQGFTMAS